MIIKTASHEADEIGVVAFGKRRKSLLDFVFRNTFGQGKLLDPQFLGDGGVEIFHAFHSDGLEHLG